MKIIIEADGDQLSVQSEGNIGIKDALQMLFGTQLHILQDCTTQAPEDKQEDVKGELYDLFNYGASRTLEHFAPEKELRPNLTSQAILDAENAIILNDRLDEVEVGS